MPSQPTFHTHTALARGLRELFVLSPVDLAVSKIARLADNDREDIQALVRLGLTTAQAIEQRATSALAGYVGNHSLSASLGKPF
jgi:hypothetical protein